MRLIRLEPGAGVEAGTDAPEAAPEPGFQRAAEADWTSESFATDRGALEDSLGTELSNAFDDDRAATPLEHSETSGRRRPVGDVLVGLVRRPAWARARRLILKLMRRPRSTSRIISRRN